MRHWPLRWFRRAAGAGRAIDERFTPAGKWLLSVAGFAGVFSTDPERTHAWLLFTSTVSLLAVSLLASRLWRPRLSARRVLPPHVTALAEASYVIALRNEGSTACGRHGHLPRCSPPTRQATAPTTGSTGASASAAGNGCAGACRARHSRRCTSTGLRPGPKSG
jgi:hypothetical protein